MSATVDLNTVLAVGSTILTVLLSGYLMLFRFMVGQWKESQTAAHTHLEQDNKDLRLKADDMDRRLRDVELANVKHTTLNDTSKSEIQEVKGKLEKIEEKLDRLLSNRASLADHIPGMQQGKKP